MIAASKIAEGLKHHCSPSAAMIETPSIAEILQNQVIAALKSKNLGSEHFRRPQIADLELYVAALERVAAEAEARSEQWQQEAEAGLKRTESLETKVAALEQAAKEGELETDRWREQ